MNSIESIVNQMHNAVSLSEISDLIESNWELLLQEIGIVDSPIKVRGVAFHQSVFRKKKRNFISSIIEFGLIQPNCQVFSYSEVRTIDVIPILKLLPFHNITPILGYPNRDSGYRYLNQGNLYFSLSASVKGSQENFPVLYNRFTINGTMIKLGVKKPYSLG